MKVTVLYGGPSAEREVSLVSGKAVAGGLREAGHQVNEVDVRPETLEAALANVADVVFPVLHGTWGEDGQLQQILEQRKAQRTEGGEKLAFLEAELTRIHEQVELIREQAVLSTDPELLSRRIDEIATTLGGTSQWIRDQQQVYGVMQDLVAEPPPLPLQSRGKVSQ